MMINQDQRYPRLLVISHNCFSTTSNTGKTLTALLGDWPNANLRQLYFWPERPDSAVCNNYFRITDSDVLRAFVRKSVLCGSPIEKEHISSATRTASVYKWRVKNNDFFKLMREVMWASKVWHTSELKNWLKEFNPQLIFFHAGNNLFIYKIVWEISKAFSIPIIVYITDDYVIPRVSISPIYWLRLYFVRKYLLITCRAAQAVLTVGDAMSNEYKRMFGIDSKVVMNYVERETQLTKTETNIPLRLVYLGGFHLNRWKTLVLIIKCLNEINKHCVRAKLEIYSTQAPNANLVNAVHNSDSAELCGSLNAIQVEQVLSGADILVHVEAFDYASRCSTRLSVSTKIPEYLATGKCIIAVGPNDIASINYLQSHDAAITITCQHFKSMVKILRSVIVNDTLRSEYGARGKELAVKKHSGYVTREIVNKCLLQGVK